MKARLEALLRRLGPAGIVALGLFLAAGAFYVNAVVPAEEEAAAQRAALERLRSRTPYRPVSVDGRAEELRRFYLLFPPPDHLNGELERLHRLARHAGLDLAQGEYRLEKRTTGLWAYRVTLPVRGSYGQFREFLSSLLKDMPTASIDALRFERKRAADTQLEAQVRLTLYASPPEMRPGELQ
ncbi:MAG TPA: GspMb/PilO family protein [Burkholderiales bacterium]|nr:GspMb/PilO family protein [Burkholderiales bacterium]